MKKGSEIKYDRLRSLEKKAQENEHTALCLPVYRTLVNKTSDLIVPHVQELIDSYAKRPGKPGYNAMAVPFLKDLGARKASALAVVCVVNSFHRPISYQSLAVKIGTQVAIEWVLMKEDTTLIKQINRYRYHSVGNGRKMQYLQSTLRKIKEQGLSNVDPIARAAIGNILLGIICRTPLVETSTVGTKGLTTILASEEVIKHLENSHHASSHHFPILVPEFVPSVVAHDSLIKSQRGHYTNLSTLPGMDTDLGRAASVLNNVGWHPHKEQLQFIKECANARHSVMGLPYIFSNEFPRYDDSMDDEQAAEIRRARARMYSERNKNRARRARLLSCLSFLPDYCNRECFFTSEADFRGRLYTKSDLVSYQGPDWLRSLWHFTEEVSINDKNDLDWLYIHAANCFGYDRISFSDRIVFVEKHLDSVCGAAASPWEHIPFLERAKHPFRFLAACREISLVRANGWGTPSTLPVQIDATSQGIQIWSSLYNDQDLMRASNVIGEEPRDIYTEFADMINDIILTEHHEDSTYFRTHPIDRSLAKKVLMRVSYGGSIYSIRDAVDGAEWAPSFRARQWLAKTLWDQSQDTLHSVIKVQQRMAQGVTRHHRSREDSDRYMWKAPSGLNVCQRYMKDKRVRIKDAVGNTIHTYVVGTEEYDIRRCARSFPPNFVHSLDASILTKAIATASATHGIKSFMSIHDCIGVHASHVSCLAGVLAESFTKVIRSDEAKVFQDIILGPSVQVATMVPTNGDYLNKLSPYLFS